MADNINVTPGTGATLRAQDYTGSGPLLIVYEVVTATPTILTGNMTISVTAGASKSISAVPSGATHGLATVDSGGGDVRYWEDASAPSTSTGLLVPAGGAVEFTNLADVRMSSTTGTVLVNVSFRKYSA